MSGKGFLMHDFSQWQWDSRKNAAFLVEVVFYIAKNLEHLTFITNEITVLTPPPNLLKYMQGANSQSPKLNLSSVINLVLEDTLISISVWFIGFVS